MKYYILNFSIVVSVLFSSFSIANEQTAIGEINKQPKVIKYFDCPCPHLIAHRGASGSYPDSSLLAFEKALELKADILELDVHLSKDKHIIVNHDSSLLRTTGLDSEIESLSSHEISNTDAGFTFQTDAGEFPFRGKDVKPITLKELVEAFPNSRFNIEIKPNSTQLAKALNKFITKQNLHDRVVVASKHAYALEYFRERTKNNKNKPVTTSAHLNNIIWAYIYWIFNIDMNKEDTSYELLQLPYQLVNRSVVDYFHRQGIQVHVWTVNDKKAIKNMLSIGVDGIMTDYPELAYPLFVEQGFR
jgi:glycerophosphoryl diester phosphodiesterase